MLLLSKRKYLDYSVILTAYMSLQVIYDTELPSEIYNKIKMSEPLLKMKKVLTLQERIIVIERREKGESTRKRATSLSIGKTQM